MAPSVLCFCQQNWLRLSLFTILLSPLPVNALKHKASLLTIGSYHDYNIDSAKLEDTVVRRHLMALIRQYDLLFLSTNYVDDTFKHLLINSLLRQTPYYAYGHGSATSQGTYFIFNLEKLCHKACQIWTVDAFSVLFKQIRCRFTSVQSHIALDFAAIGHNVNFNTWAATRVLARQGQRFQTSVWDHLYASVRRSLQQKSGPQGVILMGNINPERTTTLFNHSLFRAGTSHFTPNHAATQCDGLLASDLIVIYGAVQQAADKDGWRTLPQLRHQPRSYHWPRCPTQITIDPTAMSTSLSPLSSNSNLRINSQLNFERGSSLDPRDSCLIYHHTSADALSPHGAFNGLTNWYNSESGDHATASYSRPFTLRHNTPSTNKQSSLNTSMSPQWRSTYEDDHRPAVTN